MPTLIPFIPSNISPPSFNAVLDGSSYRVTVTWNISAFRYYVNIYDTSGNWIITVPLITTPPAETIASISYDRMSGLINVTKNAGLYKKPGQIVRYTLEGFQPDVLNGYWRCLTINTQQFSFPIDSDPGLITTIGTANRLMNMVATVFSTSTLVYRNGNFEVSP
jgi:hypothetical protein